MSCDWDIACLDCDEDSGIADANHALENMVSLVAHRDALAAVAPLFDELERYRLLDLRVGDYGLRHVPAFMAKHAGHRIAPRDEYGRAHEP